VTWILTAGGRRIDLAGPAPGQIDGRDLAAHLAKIGRWTGATVTFYSVAQHSLLVADEAARLARLAGAADDEARAAIELAALLHDAHEAYLGDIATPIKRCLATLAGGQDVVAMLATTLDSAILPAFGLPWPLPDAWRTIIHAADQALLATERRDLMPQGPDLDLSAEPLPNRIVPLAWDRAEARFHSRLCRLDVFTGVARRSVA